MMKYYSLKRLLFLIIVFPVFIISMFVVFNIKLNNSNSKKNIDLLKQQTIDKEKDYIKNYVSIIKSTVYYNYSSYLDHIKKITLNPNDVCLEDGAGYIILNSNRDTLQKFNYQFSVLGIDTIEYNRLTHFSNSNIYGFIYKIKQKNNLAKVFVFNFLESSEYKNSKQFINKINHLKKDFYIFILDKNSKVLDHIDSTKIDLILKKEYPAIYKKMINRRSDGFITYNWQQPSNKIVGKKISYITEIDSLDWLIGAGIYYNNILKDIEQFQKKSINDFKKQELSYAVFIVLLLIIILLIFVLIIKWIYLDLNVFKEFYEKATKNQLIDLEKLRVKEFVEQAKFANNMILEKVNFESQLTNLALTDSLTKINNRRAFMNELRAKFSYSKRYSTPLSIIYFDIDHFKNINDTYGHDVGDKVLTSVVQTVSKIIRNSDIFGRIGGEEFAIASLNSSRFIIVEVAERIRQTVENTPIECGDFNISVTISLGISTLSTEETEEELLINADKHMYNAKQTGRNKVCYFGKEDCVIENSK